jgi:large subunit ribosomal protein L22
MTGPKTNERPGTRAEARYIRMSASKARAVLDLIRGLDVAQADQVLQFCERDASIPIRKCLASAIANAEHNDSQLPDELYVSACYADEGPTLKRWRPRARGRATRIRKRTCHIVVIVSRMPEALLERQRARDEAKPSNRAARRSGQQAQAARRERVARSRAAAAEAAEPHDHDHDDHDHEHEHEDVVEPEMVEVDEVELDEAEVEAPEAEVETAEVEEAEAEADEDAEKETD